MPRLRETLRAEYMVFIKKMKWTAFISLVSERVIVIRKNMMRMKIKITKKQDLKLYFISYPNLSQVALLSVQTSGLTIMIINFKRKLVDLYSRALRNC